MKQISKYFCITIDTEADNAWDSKAEIKLENFKEIPKFQELCEKYGIIPTYLLSYEYASYKPAVDYLKQKSDLDKCEIGHHLHVWTTPPFSNDKNGVDMDWIHAYQFELPDDLFRDKTNSLHETIKSNFGKAPTSHRAGRWGVDERTYKWLKEKKYSVDTSVVPGVNWSNNIGRSQKGPDFSQKSLYPVKDDMSGMFEIPVSVNMPSKILRKYLKNKNIMKMSRLGRKILKKLNTYSMLRPNPKYDMKYYDKFINKLAKLEMPVINMMLHSSELALGQSPYTQTIEDHHKIWDILERVFRQISRSEYEAISLTKCSKILEKVK